MKIKEKNYWIELFRLIACIMVISIHTTPFFEINSYISSGVVNVISRVAVPFFFSLTGYFYINNLHKEEWSKNYTKKILKIYIIWSIVYFPLSINILKKNHSGFLEIIGVYLRNIIFGGSYFHLWYLSALIFSVVVFNFFYKKFSFGKIQFLSIVLYLLGLLGTTYYGVLSNDLKYMMNIYFRIFIGTRNGLFLGIPFLVLGATLAKLEIKNYSLKKILKNILICYCFMFLEIFFVKSLKLVNVYDTCLTLPFLMYNILIFLFNDYEKIKIKKYLEILFKIDTLNVYLIHGIYLVVFVEILKYLNLENQRTLYFILVLFSSIFSSILLKKIKAKIFIKG